MRRKIIQNYALIEVIGEGMYGTVYKATHMQTNQQFAVKAIPILKFQQNPKLQQCTVNEIKILQTIQKNPFIIKYIEMLKTPNNFYFVYQFCNGGTLQHRLKQQNKLSQKEALKIFRQILEAFKVLNKYNIMHRDLKPDNIFFHNGNLKLGDFGFCKTLGSPNDMACTMLGSPIYMAPEVLKGQSYTSKADLWSLGVVLYEMLFGVCPFQSNSIAKLITVLADTQLKIPVQINPISSATQGLLKKLLVKDQFKRIDWFQLLNFNITEDGVISQPFQSPSLDQLKLTSSEKNIDQYVRKHSDQSSTGITNQNNELTFKKKADLYTKSNTQLNRGQKNQFKSATTYDTYNTSTSSNSPKKGYMEQIKMQQNPFSSPNLLKRNLSSDQIDSKRKFLLEQHLICINAVKTAVNFLKFGQSNGLIFALLIFKKVQQKLRRVCDSIVLSESQIWDINTAINNQLSQIQKQTAQVFNQVKNCNIDYSLIDSPRTLLRQKYSNRDEVNLKLWYQLISFLNESKPNPRASNMQFQSTIQTFIS